jgi:cytochrome c553
MLGKNQRAHGCRRCLASSFFFCFLALYVIAAVTADGRGGQDDPGAIEFFEKSVRPILAARCQGCHGAEKQKGGLRLDVRAALIAGGLTGPAVVPGSPNESLLVDAINYGDAYQMPPKSKLPATEIATLTEWVKRGAPWGVESRTIVATPTPGGKGDKISADEFEARARYWSFQPIRPVAPPPAAASRADWARNGIDRFIERALDEHGLSPAPEADRRILIRRLCFDLIGLPPSPDQVAAFLADPAADAYERLVDRLLADPRHGERWGRHWLDLVRYAETGGHEFDYDIVHAFRYRDYVIRALNADLPYHQFVTEHVAGDLLETPRRHPADGFNESILGTGFYFLGEGTHSPVDVREEQMRRIDNQIDVFAKAFLGLTVACARCHDHKFDPITTADYYALAGFLRSSRHHQATIDRPEPLAGILAGLAAQKKTIAALLASGPDPAWAKKPVPTGGARPASSESGEVIFEDFDHDSFDGWFVSGDAFGEKPSQPGDWRLELSPRAGRAVLIKPGQAHSGISSDRLRGVLRSRSFTIESRFIHWLVAGEGGRINVVVDGFEKIRDPIYGALSRRIHIGDQPRFITQDLGMWVGHSAYLEISDGGTIDFDGPNARQDDGQGHIAVDEIWMSNRPAPPPLSSVATPAAIDLAEAGQKSLAASLESAVAAARQIDAEIAEPTLALAIADGTGVNEHVHIRGSHKNLGEIVPRRFLQVLAGSSATTHADGSGRLELARQIINPATDPLLPRVLVNRLWKHHFGAGIVTTTDDFGAMGRKPSHPELLDWLAREFVGHQWSLKSMHRLMVSSSTYRMVSFPRADAERTDPSNTYLHRMNVRRLEAEAIRDTLLAVSGRLDTTMFGPSVPVYLTSFMEGRGRPGQSGPLDGAGRRSVYVNIRRNFLDPMFLAFDMPVPFSTMGRRNVSNVPAQALTLMNDPLVVAQARQWAHNALATPGQTDGARLDQLYLTALARRPTDLEARACLAFLATQKKTRSGLRGSVQDAEMLAWSDLCHVLVNMKEFIFVD